MQPPYSPEDDEIIRQNYMALGPSALGRLLGRNHSSVRKRAIRLGVLVRCHEPNIRRSANLQFTPQQDEQIRKRYYELGPADLARKCGTTMQHIIDRARHLGVAGNGIPHERVRSDEPTRPLLAGHDGIVEIQTPPNPVCHICGTPCPGSTRGWEPWARVAQGLICPACEPGYCRSTQANFSPWSSCAVWDTHRIASN